MAPKNVFLLFVLTSLMAYATEARNYDLSSIDNIKPGQNLAARLDANGDRVVQCWYGILKFQSCTKDYVVFFLAGQTISPECCSAVDIVTSECSPFTTLPSLGFTPQEGNILTQFCAASSAPAVSPVSS